MFGIKPSAPTEVLVYSGMDSPRLRYVLHIIFGVLYPCAYRLTANWEEWVGFQGVRVGYGCGLEDGASGSVRIPSDGLVEYSSIQPITPEICSDPRFVYPALFPVTSQGQVDFSFDLFSMVFFLLSRYEEYFITQRDVFGRMPAKESWQYKWGILEYPLVDYWVGQFIQSLRVKWPDWAAPSRKFTRQLTCDIDIAWAFLHRPWWRQALALGRDVWRWRREHLRTRMRVWFRRIPDPYDTYPLLEKAHWFTDEVLFFFLLSDYAPNERAISYRHPKMRALVRSLSERFELGIHPSLASHRSLDAVMKEKKRLEHITGKEVIRSRQHFLAFSLPETYRRLEQAGIKWDYSMGYAECPGFRAGISVAFPWYDLYEERMTSLMVQPFQVMDVTLKQYQKLQPAEAMACIARLQTRVQQVGGTFSLLWHNSSFYEEEGWDGWDAVFRMATGIKG